MQLSINRPHLSCSGELLCEVFLQVPHSQKRRQWNGRFASKNEAEIPQSMVSRQNKEQSWDLVNERTLHNAMATVLFPSCDGPSIEWDSLLIDTPLTGVACALQCSESRGHVRLHNRVQLTSVLKSMVCTELAGES